MTRDDLLPAAIVGAALSVLIGGVALAFWWNDESWLWLSAVAFILFYAG